jgi:hypothetical protein
MNLKNETIKFLGILLLIAAMTEHLKNDLAEIGIIEKQEKPCFEAVRR